MFPQVQRFFETKVFPCSKYNQLIAKLVFAWESASAEEMEILGKKFEIEASVPNYPIWVLGAPDCDDDDIARHFILQIAPTKGEVCGEHPDDMNKRLIELDDNHC